MVISGCYSWSFLVYQRSKTLLIGPCRLGCYWSPSGGFAFLNVSSFYSKHQLTTANKLTNFSCRSSFITLASARKASGVMLPGFNVLIATSTFAFHIPAINVHSTCQGIVGTVCFDPLLHQLFRTDHPKNALP